MSEPVTRANGRSTGEHFIAVSKISAVVRREIKAYTDEIIAPGVGEALGGTDARIVALEARLNRIEAAMREFKYCGAWEQERKYAAGNFVTLGAVWHANADTTSRPGTDSTWTMAVPKGRDGKDYVPPPPSPGGPRTVRSSR
jgi:hypothetical protein